MKLCYTPHELYAYDLAYAYGKPRSQAVMRQQNSDFKVVEELGFEPSGEGEHVYLQIEKDGENTEFVAKQIAKNFSLPAKRVSYSGLKDRHGVTVQWYSIHLPGPAVEDSLLQNLPLKLLSYGQHRKKLRRGVHQGNFFTLVFRQVQGEKSEIEDRLRRIQKQGVPNYFGVQRFGFNGNNLINGQRLLLAHKKEKNRHKRSLYLSSIRSWLFNIVLHHRVRIGNWCGAEIGDLLNIDGSGSIFPYHAATDHNDIQQRVLQGKLHATAALWGENGYFPLSDVGQLEAQVLHWFQPYLAGLETQGLSYSRRPLRVMAKQMQWHWRQPDQLELEFFLPRGSFATSLCRELFLT